MTASTLHARRAFVRVVAFAPAVLARPALARSADRGWPTRPLRIIVPFRAGGTSDLLARIVAERLGPRLGVAVQVDNRPGASGAIGTGLVARGPADGHLLGLATQSTHAAVPALGNGRAYDPLQDFAPVALLARVPNVLAVHRTVPATDLADLVRLARARPNALSFGSPGIGSAGHLRMLQMSARLKVELRHVPYNATWALLSDARSGRLSLFGDNLLAVLAHLGDPLRPLAVSGPRRAPALPQVPTFVEQGMPEAGEVAWFGLAAPAATPPEIIDRLHRELSGVLSDASVARLLEPSGGTVVLDEPQRLREAIAADLQAFRALVAEHGLSAG